MPDNILYIPELNPVIFYDVDRANLSKYYTKFMEYWTFPERLYFWQERCDYKQIWQTTDIIVLQFISNCDPILVKLINCEGRVITTLPALIGLANETMPGFYLFKVELTLAEITGVVTGCYRIQIEAGSGVTKKTLISDWQYISEAQIKNTVLMEYSHSKYHKDVIFEDGTVFQFRIHANFGFLEKPRTEERSRNQKNNSVLLSSKSAKQWPIYYGDHFGIPDDIFNLIDEIWGCDTVKIDNRLFGLAEPKPEFFTADKYPKRGVKYMVEPGLNRSSRMFTFETDPEKRLIGSILVEAKVFGDISNQGSANTIPVLNFE